VRTVAGRRRRDDRGLREPWNDWEHLSERGRHWAGLDLRSDEVLAQVLDHGSLDDWRELFALASGDPWFSSSDPRCGAPRPDCLSGFWLSALVALGEDIDWRAALPEEHDL
jgi:hypothetical protein